MSVPFGASPDEWAHFDLILGLTADLLTVVSNPSAVISPNSKMKGLGKTPSTYNRAGQVIGLKDWTDRQTTGAQIEAWAKVSDYGICIQTRLVRGLDIDVADAALADRIAARFADLVGRTGFPSRGRSNSGKRLLGFALAGDFRKRSFKVDGGLVEFLAGGQQFIAVGTHPSGARYEWAGGLPHDFPEISADDFERAWAALVAEFAVEPERRSLRREPGMAGDDAVVSEDDTAVWLVGNWPTYGTQGGKLFVDCPWKAGHSGDSGETEAAWLLAGTGGYAMGHFECLHASCAARTDQEFLAAVGWKPAQASDFKAAPGPAPEATGADPVAVYLEVAATLPDPTPSNPLKVKPTAPHPEGVAVLPLPGFVRDGKGDVEPLLPNVVRALESDHACGVRLQYDTFRDELMTAAQGTEGWVPFVDADAVDLRIALEAIRFKPVGKELMRDALVKVARDHQFDSASFWLETVVPAWDGVPRIERFYPDYMKTKDDAYTRAVGRYVWSAHAGRILSPGCQVDMVPVLIGEEGLRKSSGVRAIAPDDTFFAKLDLDVRDEDLSRKMRGALVGELDELKGLSGRSAEAIKSWVTLPFDEWVPKYAERKMRFFRRVVFHGTGNDREFMGPNTGLRRWLPMDVLDLVDVDRIVADRLQLWAEGRELFLAKGVDYEEAEQLARGEHRYFKATDPWEYTVGRWLDDADIAGRTPRQRGGIRAEDVLSQVLGLDPARTGKREEMRIGEVLKALGLERTQGWIGGKNRKVWNDPDQALS